MHLIITDAWLANSRAIHLSGSKLLLALLGFSLALILFSVGLYHWVFLKWVREGWPVIDGFVKLAVKDEFALRDRFMRENLDVMARRIGDMQAKLLQLESLGERVSGLAGINPAEIKTKPGQGGALVSGRPMSMDELQKALDDLERLMGQRADLMSVAESRLFEQKIKTMMIPTQHPVETGGAGSGFGWRIDPFTGRSALHTGIDYQSPVGTAILAAAGGVVVTQEFRPDYGNMIEIDHGKDLITLYAHASKVLVKKGDLVKRGQKIAEVGTTGRSTGPHLHFEVLVRGVPQDPNKFMQASRNALPATVASAAPLPAAPAVVVSPTLKAPPPVVVAPTPVNPPPVKPAPVAAGPVSIAPIQPPKPPLAPAPLASPAPPAPKPVPATSSAPVAAAPVAQAALARPATATTPASALAATAPPAN